MYAFMPANKKKVAGEATLGAVVTVALYLKITLQCNLGHIIIIFKEK